MGEKGSRTPARRPRRAALAIAGFVLAGAFYLLLIDTTDPPELYAGIGVVAIAVVIFELSREQAFAEASVSPAGLWRAWRLAIKVPADIARLIAAAFSQLVSPRPARGRLRAVAFHAPGEDSRDVGRRALAEALGSVAPNTIVIGVDKERGLLLAHQLEPSESRSLDVLELG